MPPKRSPLPIKERRQRKILDIVRAEIVDTQEELAKKLRQKGIVATQGTISRDIKELGLVKGPVGDGRYRYLQAESGTDGAASERLMRIFRQCVLGVEVSENLIVVQTLAATADAVCEAIDTMHIPEIIGTMAGERNIFLVVHPKTRAIQVASQLRSFTE